MIISDTILQKFKDRKHITHNSEDENLIWLLSSSYFYLKNKYGEFDIESNLLGQELVIERAGFAYEENLGFFDEVFQSLIYEFGVSQASEANEKD